MTSRFSLGPTRSGFVLPAVVLVLLALGVIGAGGALLAHQKRTIDQNQASVATLNQKIDASEADAKSAQEQAATLAETTATLKDDVAGLQSGTAAQPVASPSPAPLPNTSLEHANLTVAMGKGLQGGGTVSLGGTLTLSNAGVTKLTGTANQVSVSSATGDTTLSLPQDIATTSSPTFAGLAVSGAITQGTWNGSAVSPAYGGTGLSHFAVGDLLYASSADTLDKLAVGTSGQCLVALSGKPTWSTCATFGPAVTSLNGQAGTLSLANASASGATITIDNASTTTKGIASFNAANFLVSGGAVNTVQNIASSASPSFAGLAIAGGVGIGTSAPSASVGGLDILAPGGQPALKVSSATQGELMRFKANGNLSVTHSIDLSQDIGSGPNAIGIFNPGGTGAAISNFNGGLALQVFTSNPVSVANGLTVNNYTNPLSPLSVTGGAALGSYGSSVAAPTDGLIVSGNVGIGTATPTEKLTVAGNVAVTGNIVSSGTVTTNEVKAAGGQRFVVGGAYGTVQYFAPPSSYAYYNAYMNAADTQSNGGYTVYNDASQSLSAQIFGSAAGGTSFGLPNASLTNLVAASGVSALSVGTMGNVPLVLGTSGSERVRVSGSGNVGVGTSSPQQKLEVSGGVRLNTTTAKPACDASARGTFWVSQGASGVKDSVEVCAKDASNAYAYRTLY